MLQVYTPWLWLIRHKIYRENKKNEVKNIYFAPLLAYIAHTIVKFTLCHSKSKTYKSSSLCFWKNKLDRSSTSSFGEQNVNCGEITSRSPAITTFTTRRRIPGDPMPFEIMWFTRYDILGRYFDFGYRGT